MKKTLSVISLAGMYASEIRIEDRGGNGVFVLFRTPYGVAYRKFGTSELAERFASGEKIEFAVPVKSKKLLITAAGSKPARFENWTERMTNEEITREPVTGYHFGFSGNVLAPVETCFYGSWATEKTLVPPGTIMIEIPVGTKIKWYDTEFRTILSPEMPAWKLKSGWLKTKLLPQA
ncbi:MAG: hypothetical protein WA125_17510 [Desulfosporosinus sp.]